MGVKRINGVFALSYLCRRLLSCNGAPVAAQAEPTHPTQHSPDGSSITEQREELMLVKNINDSLYTSFHWNASEHFKMKNHAEMIVSLLLKILINDHSLNPSKKAINRLLLTTTPGAPSRSTDGAEELGIIHGVEKGGSSVETCPAWMQAEQSLKEETFLLP